MGIGSFPCNSGKCNKCPYINRTPSLKINGKTFFIKGNLTCNSHNIIYVITCLSCNLHYIGQTINPLKTRLAQHLSDINTEKHTSISQHFNSHENPLLHFSISPIIYIPDTKRRTALEMTLIKRFNTLKPHGLNDRFDPYNLDDNIIPIIIPYSCSANNYIINVKSKINQHNINEGRIITAYKRSKNLKEIFTHKFI